MLIRQHGGAKGSFAASQLQNNHFSPEVRMLSVGVCLRVLPMYVSVACGFYSFLPPPKKPGI